MQTLITPTGEPTHVPAHAQEDRPYFRPDELRAQRSYFDQLGYVVVRGLVSPALCDEVRRAFDAELRRSTIALLRQKNMQYERNTFDSNGYLANPIFNVQDLETRRFGRFKSAALDVLTDPAVVRTLSMLLPRDPNHGSTVRLVQSMFFEGPAGTWAHQDTYYQDSATRIGGCVAGWFALEDIGPGAGRFYVCPESHRSMPVIANGGTLDFATGHDRYKAAMLDAMRQHRFELRAPFLAKGDVLFWGSCTVHGSFPGAGGRGSRSSLTAHYLRDGDALLQFHSRIREQKLVRHNGVTIGLLHDQDERRNRVIRAVAARFPNGWALARKVAIRTVMARRSAGAAEPKTASPTARGTGAVIATDAARRA